MLTDCGSSAQLLARRRVDTNLSSGASAKNRRTQKARKPIGSRSFTPGLKPRPPKEKTFSAIRETVPSQQALERQVLAKGSAQGKRKSGGEV